MSSVAVADPGTTETTDLPTAAHKEWRHSAVVAALVRVAFITIAVLATWYLSGEQGTPATGIFDMWRRWDAHHLLTLAEFGYTAPESDAHAAAFFPMFPLTVRPFLMAGIAPVPAGMLVALLASIVAGAYLYRLAEEELGQGSGSRAVLYLSLFPTAVFLVAPYSESLFLAGAIGAFYHARRERWELVSIPAAVAMASRAAGLFLLAGLVVEFVRQKDFTGLRVATAGAALAVAILPLLAYGAFLSQAMGDPFEFLDAQESGWGRRFVGPITSFSVTWGTWNEGYPTNWLLAWRVEIAAAALGVVFTLWAAVRREWGYAVYMGATLAVLMTSTWYYSVPRMLLSLFPIYLLLAAATRERPVLHDVLLMVLAPLAALGVVVFTQGNWFY